ncbi:MAG: hypothetical protein L6461_21495 [Anaerolineae bacterium]|nr:hypothetical protein [Anaerolineae bacterium]
MAKKKLQHYGDERLGLIPGQDAPTSILDMLNVGRPGPKRKSDWNKTHAPKSFSIPAPLAQAALDIREKILSCAEFDEQGNRRREHITADVAANVILNWAIDRVKQNPRLIPSTPSPHTKTGVTAYAATWDTWSKPPTFPKSTRGKKKSATKIKIRKQILSYRIPVDTENAINELSESTGVQLGEIFLRLLQIGMADYERMDFRIAPTPEVVYRSATSVKRREE